jgi:hypothetical protein
MADEPTVVVNGKEYPVAQQETLSIGEYADIEEITGQGYDLEKGGFRAGLALIYVSVKRVDPRVTVDDIRALRDSDVEWRGVPDESPPVLSGNGTLPPAPAQPSTRTSATDSAPTLDATLVSTGTKS